MWHEAGGSLRFLRGPRLYYLSRPRASRRERGLRALGRNARMWIARGDGIGSAPRRCSPDFYFRSLRRISRLFRANPDGRAEPPVHKPGLQIANPETRPRLRLSRAHVRTRRAEPDDFFLFPFPYPRGEGGQAKPAAARARRRRRLHSSWAVDSPTIIGERSIQHRKSRKPGSSLLQRAWRDVPRLV